MRKLIFLIAFFCLFVSAFAQKKPLDHSVYDSWQSIGDKLISNDGNWVAYTINVQEGDNELVVQSAKAGNSYKKSIPRGYNPVITEDSRFVIFKIKPFYKDNREAKIKKKKNDELPKDSLGILELGKTDIWKTARVKNFKTPEEGNTWLAYHLERRMDRARTQSNADRKTDSLIRVIDSLKNAVRDLTNRPVTGKVGLDADETEPAQQPADSSSDLTIRNLYTGEERIIRNVYEYTFSKDGKHLLVETSRDLKDSLSKASVTYFDLETKSSKLLSKGGNEFKYLTISDDGKQVAYLAERDAAPKALQKFFKLWYYKDGMDSAKAVVDRSNTAMPANSSVSEFGELNFSKNGKRLFFGTAPIQPPKDTTLVEIDLVKLDIWHYNDDYLQTVQLNRLRRDLQENFLAVYLIDQDKMIQLGSKELPQVLQTNEGDANFFPAITDFGKRIESQWEGNTKKDIYSINVNTGERILIKKDLACVVSASYQSPGGKYIMWYDNKVRHYFVWDGRSIKNITQKIKKPLFNEEFDSPSDPPPYGIMGWHEGDSAVYVYDRYSIWKVDPTSQQGPSLVINNVNNANTGVVFRYVKTDSTERFISGTKPQLLRAVNDKTKASSLAILQDGKLITDNFIPYVLNGMQKAKNSNTYVYTRENFVSSPDVYVWDRAQHTRLSKTNPQQANYNWGTAELFSWKAYNGKESQGIVYKPEDFDPSRKYPMICYFYETLTDGLNNYLPPSPTPSRLNIPFFVSRGYIVFAPDIHYGTGHPGRDAYDYVVSGARALVKKGFVDSTRLGLQGQSWGGYQVAYIITATKLFKAAWAGAPVANMTSAYGGIRWESGLNRQFQYERTQSRIGATLWEKPQLYIENSPLFRLPKVTTALVIMSNDADGAVPWYQGIEMFTGMRRLGKKVWLLNYNGEAHNLVERKNRKDIQVREQQFFDWLLKDERPAKWITEGVPAVRKGKDWGLQVE